jgi:hypothetical protein
MQEDNRNVVFVQATMDLEIAKTMKKEVVESGGQQKILEQSRAISKMLLHFRSFLA